MDVIDAELQRDIERVVGAEYVGASQHAMGGAYEGADRFDRSLAMWSPPIQSADADLLPDKPMADARVRDMQRNDGYVQRGTALWRDHIVGAMYMLNSKPNTDVLGLDDVWAEEFQIETESKFMLAAESTNNWFDAARGLTFTGLVRLAVGVYAAAGEFLATVEWLRDEPRPFHTGIQMVDVDRLSTPFTQTTGSRVRGGIRVNQYGAPQGYYIRRAGTGVLGMAMSPQDHVYVPARKPWGRRQVLHFREPMRPDQTRGIAELVAGLKEMRITKNFRSLTLQNAAVNAMFAASIKSELPPDIAFQSIGGSNGVTGGAVGQAVNAYANEYMKAVAKYAGGAKGLQLDGVKIPHLWPGTELDLRPLGNPGGVGQEFEQGLLRYIAATLGVGYEELAKDYSRTNYSSARAAMNETWRAMQARKKLIADFFANCVYALWFEEMMNRGELETMKYRRAPNFYEGLNAEAYLAADWIGASRGQIDELKETQAATLRIKYGLSTHEDELARLGKDWRRVYKQLERERNERERRGIELQESNAVNAASGDTREADAADADERNSGNG